MERVYLSSAPGSSLGGLVLEQDFILHIRHLQKHAEPVHVLNVQFSQMPALIGKSDLLDATHDKLNDAAKKLGTSFYLMSNGDAFLVVPNKLIGREDPITFGAKLVTELLPMGIEPGRSPLAWLEAYDMPDAYIPLRERANHYVELAKQLEEAQADTPEMLLQGDDVRGPLTAYSLSQIERLLDDLDVRRYLKSQRIYTHQGSGADEKWQPLYAENYISTRDLQQEKFPKLELRASGRLFAELASLLDRRTLAAMIRTHDNWRDTTLGLNLSAGTVLSSTFAQFCHIVHGPARQRVFFELHISELLHDFDKFMNAVELLAQEGFNVVIDGVNAQMLPYLRLAQLPVSFIKLSANEVGIRALTDPSRAALLQEIPADKLIFMHVDTPEAIAVGANLGVTRFQGFYIDELIAKRASATAS